MVTGTQACCCLSAHSTRPQRPDPRLGLALTCCQPTYSRDPVTPPRAICLLKAKVDLSNFSLGSTVGYPGLVLAGCSTSCFGFPVFKMG